MGIIMESLTPVKKHHTMNAQMRNIPTVAITDIINTINIVNYLEIFELDSLVVERKILELIDKLGSKYMYIIGGDLRYLDSILE